MYTYPSVYIYIRAGTQQYSSCQAGVLFLRDGLLDWPTGADPMGSSNLVCAISNVVRTSGVSSLISLRSLLAREWSSAKYHVHLLWHLTNQMTCNSH